MATGVYFFKVLYERKSWWGHKEAEIGMLLLGNTELLFNWCSLLANFSETFVDEE